MITVRANSHLVKEEVQNSKIKEQLKTANNLSLTTGLPGKVLIFEHAQRAPRACPVAFQLD